MKFFLRACMLCVVLSYTLPSLAMVEGEKENNQTIGISTNNETPKKTSLFVRCMRPPVKTIYVMTSLLSYVFGCCTFIALLDTNGETFPKYFKAWFINKAIYHLSDYTLEEMS